MKPQNFILWTATAFIFALSVREVWQEVTSKNHQLEVLEEDVEVWEASMITEAIIEYRKNLFDVLVAQHRYRPSEVALRDQLQQQLELVDSIFEHIPVEQTPSYVNLVIKNVDLGKETDSIRRNFDEIAADYRFKIPPSFAFTRSTLEASDKYYWKRTLMDSYGSLVGHMCCCWWFPRKEAFVFKPSKSFVKMGDSLEVSVIRNIDLSQYSFSQPQMRCSMGAIWFNYDGAGIMERKVSAQELENHRGQPIPFSYSIKS